MKTLGLAAFAAVLLAASTAIGDPIASGCDVQNIKSRGELRSALSRRAVEVVNRAASLRGGADARLQQLVSPTATFTLGSGDVGGELGVGVLGARALAREMKADIFRFLGWDYIPTPITDACATQKVDVEYHGY